MIELTDEMRDTLWRLLPSEVQEGRGPDDILPWVQAVLAVAERDLWHQVEGARGEGICDCDDADGEPISPISGEPMDHHCDCRTVETVAAVLGRASTKHGAVCLCGRWS